MKTYEALVIFPPQFAGDGLERGKSLFQETVKKHGGNLLQANDLGRRPLGYSVKKTKEGHCVSFEFSLPPAETNSFSKALQLVGDILKFTITVKPQFRPKRVRRRKPKPTQSRESARLPDGQEPAAKKVSPSYGRQS